MRLVTDGHLELPSLQSFFNSGAGLAAQQAIGHYGDLGVSDTTVKQRERERERE